MLAVSVTTILSVETWHNLPLLLQRRRHRLTEENPSKGFGPRGESNSGRKAKKKKRAKSCSKELVRIHRVVNDILPEADGQAKKKRRRKVVEMTQEPYCKSMHNWVACPKKSRRRGKCRITSHRSVLHEYIAHRKKIGERKGASQGIMQKCDPQERNPCAQNLRIGHFRKPCHRNDASAEKHGDLAENVWKLKARDKAMFQSLTQTWQMPAPSSKKPEEREFAVDSRASLHMLSTKDSSSAQLEQEPHLVVNMFFLCRPYVTGYRRHQARTHNNCDDSFSSLGSSLTRRSGWYDDNKDSLNAIPFPSQGTLMTSHECKLTGWP